MGLERALEDYSLQRLALCFNGREILQQQQRGLPWPLKCLAALPSHVVRRVFAPVLDSFAILVENQQGYQFQIGHTADLRRTV